MQVKNFPTTRPLARLVQIDVETAHGTLRIDAEPLPLGFFEALQKEIPTPKPPRVGFIRNRGKLERDDHGQPMAEYDEEDKEYLEKKRAAERRESAALLYFVLSQSPDITFETKRESCKDAADFYDKIYQELLSAGMTIGQQLALVKVVHRASGLAQEEIDDAKKN